MKIKGFSLGVAVLMFLLMFYYIINKSPEWIIFSMGLLGVVNMYFAFSGGSE